jgi:hypothetical protein
LRRNHSTLQRGMLHTFFAPVGHCPYKEKKRSKRKGPL